ncbi:UNVERIFIED_CONTAM: putative NADH dehydrogenase [ubiquinone] 1 alpha subcomplex subunit, mitochondrial [Sesamum calycinum]|uniref:NADH dehydrogenase [ubiquinone] 1 alpha subcomplex subunit, mitochondrial n=1 Tax=Sesamum calycinum TaxID=2727403 RepID=A0AAW2RQJ8_9LAMI
MVYINNFIAEIEKKNHRKNVSPAGGTAANDDGESEGDNGDRRSRSRTQRARSADRTLQQTLEEIKAVPEDEGYRKAVESFTRHRLKVCQEEEDWEAIEKRLGCGQVEELIEEAQDELKLIGHMNEWKPWGIPDDYECEVIENDAPVPKHIPLHRPGPLPEEFYKTLEAVDTGTLKDAIASSKKEDPEITSGEAQAK